MFTCNNQTQFNQRTQNCDWWYNVNCSGSQSSNEESRGSENGSESTGEDDRIGGSTVTEASESSNGSSEQSQQSEPSSSTASLLLAEQQATSSATNLTEASQSVPEPQAQTSRTEASQNESNEDQANSNSTTPSGNFESDRTSTIASLRLDSSITVSPVEPPSSTTIEAKATETPADFSSRLDSASGVSARPESNVIRSEFGLGVRQRKQEDKATETNGDSSSGQKSARSVVEVLVSGGEQNDFGEQMNDKFPIFQQLKDSTQTIKTNGQVERRFGARIGKTRI